MIARIKVKYIVAIMFFVVIVLGTIIAVINITNYKNMDDRADIRLDFIIETRELLPKPPEPEIPPEESGDEDDADPEGDGEGITEEDSGEHDKKDEEENDEKNDGILIEDVIDEETPFDTRYFTVTFNYDGTVLDADVTRIAAISHEKAIDYATAALGVGSRGGYAEDYKYRALEIPEEEKIIYVFLDTSREMKAFRAFRSASVIVSFVGSFIICVFLIILSNVIFKPIIESYEKQKRFITDAGHELKTPLAIINANADVIEMEHGEEPWTSSIKNQTERLAKLTENLVYLSRMEENSYVNEFSQFSLSDTAREVCETWDAVAEQRGKKFSYSIESGISIRGSKNDIIKLISILLDNAMKYSDAEGNIQFSLTRATLSTELTVKNTVESIEHGNLNKLFDRFYKRDSSRNSASGSFGIGLSLAKSIVLNHKGRISARSEDGKSIVFVATF